MFFPSLGLHRMHFHCGFQAGANVSAQETVPINEINTGSRSVLLCASFPQSELHSWVDVNTIAACCKVSFLIFVQDSQILKEKAEEVAIRKSRRTRVVGFSLSRNSSGAIGRCFIIDVFSKVCVLGSFMFACIFKSCMFRKRWGGHLLWLKRFHFVN